MARLLAVATFSATLSLSWIRAYTVLDFSSRIQHVPTISKAMSQLVAVVTFHHDLVDILKLLTRTALGDVPKLLAVAALLSVRLWSISWYVMTDTE